MRLSVKVGVIAEGGDETSASAGTRVPADAEIVGEGAEIVGEGPHHIIFDLENISEHEKAAGAVGFVLQERSAGVPCRMWPTGVRRCLRPGNLRLTIFSLTSR